MNERQPDPVLKRHFVIGDIHGRYEQLVRALAKAGVNYEHDEVISLGDLVDRGPEPFLCIMELQKINNLIAVQGNHDQTCHMRITGKISDRFFDGDPDSTSTINKYHKLSATEKQQVEQFFTAQVYYHIDQKNRLFVHAGIDRYEDIEQQLPGDLLTDRNFFKEVLSMQKKVEKVACVNQFSEIYIGHTPTTCYHHINGVYKKADNAMGTVTWPIHIANCWNVDTGAGFDDGCVTVMDLETKTIYQAFVDNRDLNIPQ